jgi:hypothetical protein
MVFCSPEGLIFRNRTASWSLPAEVRSAATAARKGRDCSLFQKILFVNFISIFRRRGLLASSGNSLKKSISVIICNFQAKIIILGKYTGNHLKLCSEKGM